MTTVAEPPATSPAPTARRGPISKGWRWGWIGELVGMVVLYQLYDKGRDLAIGTTAAARAHAIDIIHAEKVLGIYWEKSIQSPFLNVDWFMAFWNIYYGTVHFGLPLLALVLLYRKLPERYVRFRNTLVLMWAIAVVTFLAYPLMPPRFMPERGFHDTAAEYFNFGPQVKFEKGRDGQPTQATLDQYGNPYAAMPSFHIGWSTWSILALWPLVRRKWLKALLVLYPFTVLFCIVVTANHWFLDAVGGWIVLALGWLGAVGLELVAKKLRSRRSAAAVDA